MQTLLFLYIYFIFFIYLQVFNSEKNTSNLLL